MAALVAAAAVLVSSAARAAPATEALGQPGPATCTGPAWIEADTAPIRTARGRVWGRVRLMERESGEQPGFCVLVRLVRGHDRPQATVRATLKVRSPLTNGPDVVGYEVSAPLVSPVVDQASFYGPGTRAVARVRVVDSGVARGRVTGLLGDETPPA